ncbi:MAG: hypothetical protein U1C46_05235 [Bacteroidales bacterium]|nr:hypothetical protein [Bacteroidales bacterium]
MLQLPVRKALFWDMDLKSMDEQTHKTYIIQQVLNYGTLDEFVAILHYYGADSIKQSSKEVGYFDPKTFSFVTTFFNLDKNEMKCYTKKRLNQPHWI